MSAWWLFPIAMVAAFLGSQVGHVIGWRDGYKAAMRDVSSRLRNVRFDR